MGKSSLTISDLNYGSWLRAGGTFTSSVTTLHLRVNLTWIRMVWTCPNTLKKKKKKQDSCFSSLLITSYLQIPESRGGSEVQSDKKFCSISAKTIKKGTNQKPRATFAYHLKVIQKRVSKRLCAQQSRAAVTNAFYCQKWLWGMSAIYPRWFHIYHMIEMKGTSYFEKFQRQAINCLNN